ncbi:hypothetical protein FACS189459_1710 [Bacilli bacterium]|nr:hypothetical protein FACS189459_1710 [Bacilli bacterium]
MNGLFTRTIYSIEEIKQSNFNLVLCILISIISIALCTVYILPLKRYKTCKKVSTSIFYISWSLALVSVLLLVINFYILETESFSLTCEIIVWISLFFEFMSFSFCVAFITLFIILKRKYMHSNASLSKNTIDKSNGKK